jgi:hypothetical protein
MDMIWMKDQRDGASRQSQQHRPVAVLVPQLADPSQSAVVDPQPLTERTQSWSAQDRALRHDW